MTRQDFYNELLILYADQPEVCAALRFARRSEGHKRKSAGIVQKIVVKSDPTPPRKNKQPPQLLGAFRRKTYLAPRLWGMQNER